MCFTAENSISQDFFTARARLAGAIESLPRRTTGGFGTHSFQDDGLAFKARPRRRPAARPRWRGPGASHPSTRKLRPTHSAHRVGQRWAEAQRCCLSRVPAPGSPLLDLGSDGRRPWCRGTTPQTVRKNESTSWEKRQLPAPRLLPPPPITARLPRAANRTRLFRRGAASPPGTAAPPTHRVLLSL